jgi:hypothetical protein
MTVTYTTKTGKKQFKPSFKWLERAVNRDSGWGFCLSCGNSQTGCEPDARRYNCENCNEAKVYGVDELVMMGLYHTE